MYRALIGRKKGRRIQVEKENEMKEGRRKLEGAGKVLAGGRGGGFSSRIS